MGRSRLAPRLARSAALRALGRPGWLNLTTLCAPGRPAGWIWLLEKRGPVQRNDDFAAQGQCFVDVALVALIWLDGLRSWDSRASAGRPAGAAWAPRARPGRPCWLDLASIGSLWLPLAPLLARFGLVWLDLAAPAALAGSIWLLCALLGAPAGSI